MVGGGGADAADEGRGVAGALRGDAVGVEALKGGGGGRGAEAREVA